MAVYNELQVGRYVRLIQKLFGIKGRQPAPLQYSGEMGSVLSLFHGNENRYLEGWNQFGFYLTLPASAGNQNAYRIRNPASSNVVAVFTKIKVATTTASAITFIASNGTASADLATAQPMTNSRFDNRGNPTSSIIASSSQVAAPGDLANVFDRDNVGIAAGTLPSADIIITDVQELPLLPGDALQLRTSNANVESEVGFWWRERALEESERT